MADTNQVDYFYIVKSVQKKVSVKGDTYLDLIFVNSNGEIPSKVWDYQEQAHGWITPDIIVKVRGIEDMYNGKPQFKLQRIRRVCSSDEYNISDLIPIAPYDGEVMYDQLFSIATDMKNQDIKTILLEVLTRKKEEIIVFPAAVKLHHAVYSGLLYHTLSVVRLAQAVAKLYPQVNEELLLAGAILHDMAKIEELKVEQTKIASGYTTQGILLGHLVMGAMQVSQIAKEKQIESEIAMLLEHMMLSHHGIPEYGSAIRPMFIEAEILSSLDNLDASIAQITTATTKLEKGEFSEKLWAMDQRKFYKHDDYKSDVTEIF